MIDSLLPPPVVPLPRAPSRPPEAPPALTPELLARMHAWWRAANYLSVGQIYLQDNPLLETPLTHAHVKPRLLGHWGTTPGLNLLYVHLNRLIRAHGLDMLLVVGPGHGAPGIVANAWLEGSYSERFPAVARDRAGLRQLFRQFSWPGGIPSHCGPQTPGSLHEGGELGYSLAHAFGAAFDNPDLIVTCVVGDGEAETGALATSWHSNKFLNPVHDGAVLPILHLNGWKIANPTVLSRIGRPALFSLLHGCGWEPHFVEGDDPALVHPILARTLDKALAHIRRIQQAARAPGAATTPPDLPPRWPMIILRTPKGWTGPKTVDGAPVEGTWRSHQVPIAELDTPAHLALLDTWLRSYDAPTLFDAEGRLREDIARLAPIGPQRLSANPHANGGTLLRPLVLPDFRAHALAVPAPGATRGEATRVLGGYLREVMRLNAGARNFRLFGPDETASNRLGAVLEVTDKTWLAETLPVDAHLGPEGRVMEVLSEHLCEGWLEGYLLSGRHGLFSSYEAFIHIVDSMVNQHAKWLSVSGRVPWRAPIASLNILLTSHVWRQDHNGLSHQDPGFLDHLANKKAEVVRLYLPPDANCLLAVADQCLRSRQLINVIVAGKQPEWQWLDMEAAVRHCSVGVGAWHWAGHEDQAPDVVLACAGDVPTLETLAAVMLLREDVPDLRVRVVNVVDLMTLTPPSEHPHGLDDTRFDALFGTDVPVIFAFHGYPSLVHKLTYRRRAHANLHVRGFRDEGSTTTPFDMVVLNGVDRYQLALDVVRRVPRLAGELARATGRHGARLARHRAWIAEHGEDLPEVRDWRWQART